MKVGVVGAGLVGSTSAYALVMAGVGSRIVVVDKNHQRALAEADDILHAVPFAHRIRVRAGDYPDLADSRVVIVAAGVNQKPGETRLELLQRNAAVFSEVIPKVLENAPDALLLIVTNPVDIMTHLASRFAAHKGVPPNRVIGSGTALDSARFRALLGRHFGVDPQHVHGYVVGEHGDSEVLTWSLVSIGLSPLNEFSKISGVDLDAALRNEIDQRVRKAAYRIIEGKGSTYYGIGSAVAHIVNVILQDYRAILTVSSWTPEIEGVEDVTISLPRLLGGAGILATFPPPLSKDESRALRRSAQILKRAMDELDSGQPTEVRELIKRVWAHTCSATLPDSARDALVE
jgi:L-lactate dehydrogenase